MSAFSLGLYEVGARALVLALKEQPNDMTMQDQLSKYRDKLGEAKFAAIQENPNSVGAQYLPVKTGGPGKGGDTSHTNDPKRIALKQLGDWAFVGFKFACILLVAGGALFGLMYFLRKRRGTFEGDKIV